MFGRPETGQAQRWLTERKLAEHIKWLAFFGNAPLEVADAANSGRLKALETLVTDLIKPLEPLAQANRWEALVKADGALGMEELVTTVQKWLFDLGQCAVGATPRYFAAANLGNLTPRLSLPALLQAEKQVSQMRALSRHPLNPRLFLEDLCVRAFKPLGL